MIKLKTFCSLAALYLVYAVFSASWVSTGLFIFEIEKDFKIDTFDAAFLTNVVSFAKIFGSIFAGFIFAKLGFKWGYFVGCLFISFGAFGVNNYELMLFGRFCMGLGSAVAVIALVPVAKALLANPKKVLSINSTANTFGNFIGISLLGYVGTFYWKDLFIFFAILNVVLLLIFLLCFEDRGVEVSKNNTKLGINDYKLIFFMVFMYIDAIFLLNIFFVYFPKIVGSLYIDTNIKLSNFLNIINISIILCGFVGGFLANKLSHLSGIFLSKILMFCVVLILYVLGGSKEYIYLMYVLGLLFGLCYGILFSNIFMISASKDSLVSAKIMGVFWAFSYGFLVINSQSFAKIMNNFDFFTAMNYFMFVYFLSFVVLILFKKVLKNP